MKRTSSSITSTMRSQYARPVSLDDIESGISQKLRVHNALAAARAARSPAPAAKIDGVIRTAVLSSTSQPATD